MSVKFFTYILKQFKKKKNHASENVFDSKCYVFIPSNYVHREEPPQNPNKSAKKNVPFSWEFLHG